MASRISNRVKFRLEQMLIRGAHFRLVVMAGLVGLISVTAGFIVLAGGAGFESPEEAVWWAFLRLTDPGYLGDDEGLFRRTVATAVTILGIVVFMGSLVAIMTQWLTEKLRDLERGLTPIAQNDHIIVLGWTNRTVPVVKELLLSAERVQHFLRRHGARRLNVVLLVDDVTPEIVQDVREATGDMWSPRQVIFRSGSALHVDHLERVDYANAAAIVIPGADIAYGGPEGSDSRVIKTVLSISHHGRAAAAADLPLIVTEIFDARRLGLARRAYRGPIEILASHQFISRLMAQTIRHRGLSDVFAEILSHGDGNEVYIRAAASDFEGMPFYDLMGAFPHAVLLGFVPANPEGSEPVLNPPADATVRSGDRLVLLARSLAATAPQPEYVPQRLQRGDVTASRAILGECRLLILGWNHKIPALIGELSTYEEEHFHVHNLSTLPVPERQAQLARLEVDLSRIELQTSEGDYAVPSDLAAADPFNHDNILFAASDRLETGAESDARTLSGHLLLDSLRQEQQHPGILVELLDPENSHLIGAGSEHVVSPQLMSHMLAQVSLRRELRAVYDELFGPGGAEITFGAADSYEIGNRPVTFSELQQIAVSRGEIALGVRLDSERSTSGGGLRLNPDRQHSWSLTDRDEVVVLTTY